MPVRDTGSEALADPERGWAATIASDKLGGGAARRQLLFTFLIPVSGGLLLRATDAQRMGPNAAMALLVILTAASLAALILRDAGSQNALDAKQRTRADVLAEVCCGGLRPARAGGRWCRMKGMIARPLRAGRRNPEQKPSAIAMSVGGRAGSMRVAADATHPAEEFEDLYENAPSGSLSFRSHGRITMANATLSHWTGHDPGQLAGTRLTTC